MKNDKTEIIINALLNSRSVKQASDLSGIPERTIYRYMHDPIFADLYQEKRKEILKDNCIYLQNKMGYAIDELIKIIDSKKTSTNERIRAIDLLLNHAYQHNEILKDIEKKESDPFCGII